MYYFDLTRIGESRWWSWVALSWLTFVGWVIFQSILLLPLFVTITITVEVGAPSQNAGNFNLIAGLAGLGATLGAISAFFVKNNNRLGNILGILLLAAIAISASFSFLASRGTDNTAITEALTEMMGASPNAFALFLLTFPTALIMLYLGQKFLHKRTITSLHTAAGKFRISRVAQGFLLTWLVLGGFSFIGHLLGLIDVQYIFDNSRFWTFALVSLLLIPLQSATEEIVFRGYFNQGLTHILKSKWIAFVLTSLAFMALHLSNPEALEGAASGTLPIVMSGYFFFGFAMCLIVWIEDGLETAIGIHAGNNCFAAIIMNYENSVLPTPSIFLTGTDPVKDSISTFVVLGVLVAIIWFLRGGPKTSDPR